MGGFIQTASALALLSLASAKPILQEREDHPVAAVGFNLPKSYAALGDSFSSGLGSGQFLSNSRDRLDSMPLLSSQHSSH